MTTPTWNTGMSEAYLVGVQDGLDGFRRGRPNEFEACYEQGWQDGKRQRVAAVLASWDRARASMREYLENQ